MAINWGRIGKRIGSGIRQSITRRIGGRVRSSFARRLRGGSRSRSSGSSRSSFSSAFKSASDTEFLAWVYRRTPVALKAYDETKHKRKPKGDPAGGQFTDKPGAGDDAPPKPIASRLDEASEKKFAKDVKTAQTYEAQTAAAKKLTAESDKQIAASQQAVADAAKRKAELKAEAAARAAARKADIEKVAVERTQAAEDYRRESKTPEFQKRVEQSAAQAEGGRHALALGKIPSSLKLKRSAQLLKEIEGQAAAWEKMDESDITRTVLVEMHAANSGLRAVGTIHGMQMPPVPELDWSDQRETWQKQVRFAEQLHERMESRLEQVKAEAKVLARTGGASPEQLKRHTLTKQVLTYAKRIALQMAVLWAQRAVYRAIGTALSGGRRVAGVARRIPHP